MTDRGSKVRWTTAALVAPTAAALFTGTTVWAAGHQPLTAAKPAAAAPAAAPEATADPAILKLRKEIEANSAKVDELRSTVESLKKAAAAMATGASVTPGTSSRSSSSTKSGSSASRWTAPSSHKAAASSPKKAAAPKKTVHVVTPAPKAPPANTSTGASGV